MCGFVVSMVTKLFFQNAASPYSRCNIIGGVVKMVVSVVDTGCIWGQKSGVINTVVWNGK